MSYVGSLRAYLEAEERVLSELDLEAVSRLMEMMEENEFRTVMAFHSGRKEDGYSV